jgi:outer membrane lipoprotein-sorting protein
MKPKSLKCAMGALLAVSLAPALLAQENLQAVLRNMDKTAAAFRGLQADVEWVKYTAIVDVKTVEKGKAAVRRGKGGAVDILIEFTDPYPYFLSVHGTDVQIYRPRINEVQQYDLSKSRETLDQALLVGFGTAGSFLEKHYHVTFKGEEPAAGEVAVKLELVPKSEEMKKNVPKLEMWVSKRTWHPVQEKLHEPNAGDYRLYTYTKITLNPPLKDSQFRLDLPKNVKRVSPQK